MISNTFHDLWDANTLYSAEVYKGGGFHVCIHVQSPTSLLRKVLCIGVKILLIPESERSVGVPCLLPSTDQTCVGFCMFILHILAATEAGVPFGYRRIASGWPRLCSWLAGLPREESPQARHMLPLLKGSDGLERTNKTQLELTKSLKRLIFSMGSKEVLRSCSV